MTTKAEKMLSTINFQGEPNITDERDNAGDRFNKDILSLMTHVRKEIGEIDSVAIHGNNSVKLAIKFDGVLMKFNDVETMGLSIVGVVKHQGDTKLLVEIET